MVFLLGKTASFLSLRGPKTIKGRSLDLILSIREKKGSPSPFMEKAKPFYVLGGSPLPSPPLKVLNHRMGGVGKLGGRLGKEEGFSSGVLFALTGETILLIKPQGEEKKNSGKGAANGEKDASLAPSDWPIRASPRTDRNGKEPSGQPNSPKGG